jgi:hypothetical protein
LRVPEENLELSTVKTLFYLPALLWARAPVIDSDLLWGDASGDHLLPRPLKSIYRLAEDESV